MEIKEIADKNFGTPYLKASLDTQEPKNKFIPKKGIQKINKKISFVNNERRSSIPKYKLKLSKIFPPLIISR